MDQMTAQEENGRVADVMRYRCGGMAHVADAKSGPAKSRDGRSTLSGSVFQSVGESYYHGNVKDPAALMRLQMLVLEHRASKARSTGLSAMP